MYLKAQYNGINFFSKISICRCHSVNMTHLVEFKACGFLHVKVYIDVDFDLKD